MHKWGSHGSKKWKMVGRGGGCSPLLPSPVSKHIFLSHRFTKQGWVPLQQITNEVYLPSKITTLVKWIFHLSSETVCEAHAARPPDRTTAPPYPSWTWRWNYFISDDMHLDIYCWWIQLDEFVFGNWSGWQFPFASWKAPHQILRNVTIWAHNWSRLGHRTLVIWELLLWWSFAQANSHNYKHAWNCSMDYGEKKPHKHHFEKHGLTIQIFPV